MIYDPADQPPGFVRAMRVFMVMGFAASLVILVKPTLLFPNVVLVQTLGFGLGVISIFMGIQFGGFGGRATRALAICVSTFIVTCVTLALVAITGTPAMLILPGVAGVVALIWAACSMALRLDGPRVGE
jgi:hypothetical protein